MAITTVDAFINALGNNRQKFPISRASIASQVAGAATSYWRSTGYPNTGAIPAAAAVCDNTFVGAIPFTNPTSGLITYIARMTFADSTTGSVEIHDRLVHMGGLSGTVTTAQTVGVNLSTMQSTSNLAARLISTDYTRVQWWIEIYTSLGSTAVTATVAYTDSGGTSQTASVAITTTNRVASNLIPIYPSGTLPIRSIESITLSATTGTAGSFGVTATIERTNMATSVANVPVVMDWAALGLPNIPDSSCLFLIHNNTGTTAGSINGSITLIQG